MFLRMRKQGKVVLWHIATFPLDLCCEPARIILHVCHLKTNMHNIPYYDQTPLNPPNSARQAFIHSP